MDLCCKYIKKFFFVTIIGLVLPFVSFAQSQINTEILQQPVRSILEKYIYLSGEIRPDVQPDPARPFVQLFRSARTEVYDDLSMMPGSELISIHDYSEKIKNAFPEGIVTSIDLDNFKIAKIPEDADNRMIVEVKLRKTVGGILNGQAYKHSGKVIFLIGFDLVDGEYRNFLIHGISPVVEHDHDLILSFSPSMNRISSNSLLSDQRFVFPWTRSYKAGLHYQYSFNSYLGIRLGLDAALNRHNFGLDRFDPLEGHDPNLKDVEWSGDLYYLELPVNVVFNIHPLKRLTLEAYAGLFGGYLIFADIETTAVNSHSGDRLYGVMSDPYVYNNISKYDLGVSGGLGVRFDLSSRISLIARAGYRHGIVNLAATSINKPYEIYQGQFHPLFSNGEARINSQSYQGFIGLTYRIFGGKLL